MVIRNSFIQPNTGMLNLNIVRLERYLKLLEQQQALSSAYPEHKAKLLQKQLQVQLQLQKLVQHRNKVQD